MTLLDFIMAISIMKTVQNRRTLAESDIQTIGWVEVYAGKADNLTLPW
jgi:hypothetical protein